MSSFGLVSSQTIAFFHAYLRQKVHKEMHLGKSEEAKGNDMKVALRPSKCRHEASTELNTFDAEMDLWKKIVYDVGLNISPGSSCHYAEPGWFRACSLTCPSHVQLTAIRRIRLLSGPATNTNNQISHQNQQQSNANSRRSHLQMGFRLSFNDRQRER
ncbi:1-aminocyclopropane-1-carboxylate synthase [Datura stramonium]|uniref:1-aminocyclopropane-1-carboxylate synthase n=1 Tax=Datura stramonium TaxID=4076 RepID=A0ABS8TIL4_DATST|nr:1-aminocyclopropane-1-carboxylate synthase [Datura stramonium]